MFRFFVTLFFMALIGIIVVLTYIVGLPCLRRDLLNAIKNLDTNTENEIV